VVVVAAGNFGNNTGRLTNPATDPLAIAVGSSNPKGTLATGDDELSTFTNQNMQEKGLDLLAPGESIASLRDEGSNIDETYPGARVGTTLFKGSGTSQSTAVVSAAAALLLQNRPSLTPDQVKRILIDSGSHIMYGVGASRGYRQLNVGRALTTATPTATQTWANSGDGTIQTARGTSAVVRDNVALTGEKSLFGAWSSSGWAAKAAARTTWSGGVWMGYRMAADGWTGTSFASKTWGSAVWPGKPWSGASSWVDPDWSGRYWSGRYWSGRYWSGRYWSSDDWSAAYWG
jgi:serine protease AprX